MARVLLAEDDAAMLEMVKHALSGDGHTVIAAQDGQEALDLLNAPGASFDVMLTDIHMPSVNGIELAGKAMALSPQLKVILMSAFVDGVTVPEDLKPRIAQILSKPLALDQVRAAVKQAVA